MHGIERIAVVKNVNVFGKFAVLEDDSQLVVRSELELKLAVLFGRLLHAAAIVKSARAIGLANGWTPRTKQQCV